MEHTDTPAGVPAARISGFACTTLTRGIDLADHLKWARSVARGVRKHYKFLPGSQEEQELESVAYLTLVRKFKEFDPSQVPAGGDHGGQFRGWVHPSIRGDCQREARRLRNGGTYHTRRERDRDPIAVVALPTRRAGDGEQYVDIEGPVERPTPETDPRLAARLRERLDRLGPAERLTVELRYGLRPGGCRTYGEIAAVLCLTKREVRALERSAMARLCSESPVAV